MIRKLIMDANVGKDSNRMLDVAWGAGQIASPAAQSGVKVSGADITSNFIEQAQTARQGRRCGSPVR
jgi:2-polyprenyl-3-methyl-5-hydroxy-6-metoxy-1,4-benzoquinol methylase